MGLEGSKLTYPCSHGSLPEGEEQIHKPEKLNHSGGCKCLPMRRYQNKGGGCTAVAAADVSTCLQTQDRGAYQALPYTYVWVSPPVVKAHMYTDTRRNTQRLQSKVVLIIEGLHTGHKSCA